LFVVLYLDKKTKQKERKKKERKKKKEEKRRLGIEPVAFI
jgi:hypothetical protein